MSDGTPDVALVNGRVVTGSWVIDRGLHYGDGLFETLSCRSGRPRFLSLHLERLLEGCRRLHLPHVDVDGLRAEIQQLAGQGDSAILKLIVTRGEAVARGYGFTGTERMTRVLLRYPNPNLERSEGVRVGIAAMRLGENPALAGLKHLNRLEQVLAQQEREDRGLDELLMLSSSGRLVSGVMSNVFIAHRGGLLTPSLELCGVAGIMRRVVLREAQRAGVHSEERILEAGDLDSAEEIFLTNSRLGVIAVVGIDGRRRVVGPMTRRVQALIAPMLENPVDE